MNLDTRMKGAMFDTILKQYLRKNFSIKNTSPSSSITRLSRNLIELCCSLSEITLEENRLLSMAEELSSLLLTEDYTFIRNWVFQNFHF